MKWNVQWTSAKLWLIKTCEFFTWQGRKQTVQGKCFLNEQQLNSSEHEDRLWWQSCKTWLHSIYQKGYQSKLLFFHSKGGQCSFWGLLYCDDRRSPWWASRDELSMIIFAQTPSWLVWILTIMPVWLNFSSFLFCSVLFLNTENL